MVRQVTPVLSPRDDPGRFSVVDVLLCHIYPSIIATAPSVSGSERLTIAIPAFTLFQVIVVIRAPLDRDRFGIPLSLA